MSNFASVPYHPSPSILRRMSSLSSKIAVTYFSQSSVGKPLAHSGIRTKRDVNSGVTYQAFFEFSDPAILTQIPAEFKQQQNGNDKSIRIECAEMKSVEEAAAEGDLALIEIFGPQNARRLPLAVDRWLTADEAGSEGGASRRIHQDPRVLTALRGTRPLLRTRIESRGPSILECHFIGFEWGHSDAVIDSFIHVGFVPKSSSYLEELKDDLVDSE